RRGPRRGSPRRSRQRPPRRSRRSGGRWSRRAGCRRGRELGSWEHPRVEVVDYAMLNGPRSALFPAPLECDLVNTRPLPHADGRALPAANSRALPLADERLSERGDAARNRSRLLDAAALLVAERGVDAVTMDAVA